MFFLSGIYTLPTQAQIVDLAVRKLMGKIVFSCYDDDNIVKQEIKSLFGEFEYVHLQVCNFYFLLDQPNSL